MGIFMPTLSCLAVPPCILVLLTECRKRLPPSLHPLLRSRSLLLLSVSTQYGSVALSCLLSPPSRPCGLQRKSMMNLAQESFTVNASNISYCFFFLYCYPYIVFILILIFSVILNKRC